MGKPGLPAPSVFRPRALILGLLAVPLGCFWAVGAEQVYLSGDPTTISIFFHAVFILLVLALGNRLVAAVAPRFALSRLELLAIYAMISASAGIAGFDFMGVFIGHVTAPYRYATPANNWEQVIQPHIAPWAAVTDPEAVRVFYEGHSSIYHLAHVVPWIKPLLIWAGFIITTQIMCLAANILLRRQWTDHEKLSFPIIQLPLAMTDPAGQVFRSRAFWIAFAIAAGINIVNGLHTWYPALPYLHVKVFNLTQYLPPYPWGVMSFTPASAYPFVIGLSYLLPTDLSFSCWFFYIFFKAQLVLGALLGWKGGMGWDVSTGSLPYVVEQGIGGYLAIVGFALWSARGHLQAVWRAVWHDRSRTASAESRAFGLGEVAQYRVAIWALIVGHVALILFAVELGMNALLAASFFLLYLVIATAITKIRAELGPPVHDLHFAGPDRVLLAVLGSRNFSSGDMVGLSFFFGYNRAYRGLPMPNQLEALKMTELLRGPLPTMILAMVAAAILGTLAAEWAFLHYGYSVGIEQMGEVKRLSKQGWQRMEAWLISPWDFHWGATAGMLFGIGFAALLQLLRFRFMWFPFHPIGYSIAANWSMNTVWMPIGLGWLWKTMTLRYGGHKLYRDLLPAAFGLVLGEFLLASIYTIIAAVWHLPVYRFWIF
jgi:hypothetical protein